MNKRAKETRDLVKFQSQPRRVRKVKRALYPKAVQINYAKILLGVVQKSRIYLKPVIQAIPSMLESSSASRKLDAGEGDLVSQYLEAARKAMSQDISPEAIKKIADRIATNTKDWQKRQFSTQLKDFTGVDVFISDGGALAFQTEQFLSENVALIKNLTDKTYFNIETMLQREISQGSTRKSISSNLTKEFGLQKRRAKLIARDQIGKYHGKVTRTRHESVGVESFTWRDSGDERVRPTHQTYDDQDYTYKDAPDGGPGQAVQCRCTGDPVLDFLL